MLNKGDKPEIGQAENFSGGSGAAISADCKNVEYAARLLDYAYSEEGNDYDYVSGSKFNTTNMGIAFSDDGIHWNVKEKPFFTMDMVADNPEITRVYDPRLVVVEDELLMCCAIDTLHGIRAAIIRIHEDFESMELISASVPDNRNMVLFPEKIDGMYVRLERPFTVYSRGGIDRFDMWISKSPDLKYWGESELLLAVEDVPFANDKIGPAAPPIKTDQGWLVTFHAVDRNEDRGKHGWEDRWTKRYTTGIMLLDLKHPEKVLGMSKEPLIAPDQPYESEEGFRAEVIFPGGMIQEDDGTVKFYYGAADTIECLATARTEDLIGLCSQPK